MRAVVQRVSEARVRVEGKSAGAIGRGLLVLVSVARDDTPEAADYLAEKIAGLRVFDDGTGKMNRSVLEVGGSVLAVSQFTLHGDCRKGRRPSFDRAAPAEQAGALYERFLSALRAQQLHVETGAFQALMQVELVNDGPVTLLVSSPGEKDSF